MTLSFWTTTTTIVMGKTFDYIPEDYIRWALKQHVFWVATAPLSESGHVNLSPKGVLGTFHVLHKNKVWYEDLTGSGIETISHLRENGRITILFNAFEGGPRILRLFGRGTVHEFGTLEYNALLPVEERNPGSRGVIVVEVDRVGTSCGWGVPLYSYAGPRETLVNFGVKLERKDQEAPWHSGHGLVAYWQRANQKSVDGLPGLQIAHVSGVTPVAPIKGKTLVTGMVGQKAKPEAIPAPWIGEGVRLVLAFVMGLVAAVMYGQFAGIAVDRIGLRS
ncbi:hypothetical protein BV25DRAFT_1893999 [Artomyces pyxidatus]|uniref:Uncharacterized protein n=1 Tax=Artomyces pyxidatus TaxID=48021 RepID=A0ACB8SJT2_9AGAM|nr:hypothetical protein BV25DRAFT_1893999 [Artomyces pyxidatus]